MTIYTFNHYKELSARIGEIQVGDCIIMNHDQECAFIRVREALKSPCDWTKAISFYEITTAYIQFETEVLCTDLLNSRSGNPILSTFLSSKFTQPAIVNLLQESAQILRHEIDKWDAGTLINLFHLPDLQNNETVSKILNKLENTSLSTICYAGKPADSSKTAPHSAKTFPMETVSLQSPAFTTTAPQKEAPLPTTKYTRYRHDDIPDEGIHLNGFFLQRNNNDNLSLIKNNRTYTLNEIICFEAVQDLVGRDDYGYRFFYKNDFPSQSFKDVLLDVYENQFFIAQDNQERWGIVSGNQFNYCGINIKSLTYFSKGFLLGSSFRGKYLYHKNNLRVEKLFLGDPTIEQMEWFDDDVILYRYPNQNCQLVNLNNLWRTNADLSVFQFKKLTSILVAGQSRNGQWYILRKDRLNQVICSSDQEPCFHASTQIVEYTQGQQMHQLGLDGRPIDTTYRPKSALHPTDIHNLPPKEVSQTEKVPSLPNLSPTHTSKAFVQSVILLPHYKFVKNGRQGSLRFVLTDTLNDHLKRGDKVLFLEKDEDTLYQCRFEEINGKSILIWEHTCKDRISHTWKYCDYPIVTVIQKELELDVEAPKCIEKCLNNLFHQNEMPAEEPQSSERSEESGNHLMMSENDTPINQIVRIYHTLQTSGIDHEHILKAIPMLFPEIETYELPLHASSELSSLRNELLSLINAEPYTDDYILGRLNCSDIITKAIHYYRTVKEYTLEASIRCASLDLQNHLLYKEEAQRVWKAYQELINKEKQILDKRLLYVQKILSEVAVSE